MKIALSGRPRPGKSRRDEICAKKKDPVGTTALSPNDPVLVPACDAVGGVRYWIGPAGYGRRNNGHREVRRLRSSDAAVKNGLNDSFFPTKKCPVKVRRLVIAPSAVEPISRVRITISTKTI